MKKLKKLFEALTTPIIALIVHIGTSCEINEDGSWDKHYERKKQERGVNYAKY